MARKYNLNEKTLNGYLQIIKTIVDDIAFEHYPRASKKTPNGYYQWRSTYILSAGDTVNNLFFNLKSMRNIDYEYHSFIRAIALQIDFSYISINYSPFTDVITNFRSQITKTQDI